MQAEQGWQQTWKWPGDRYIFVSVYSSSNFTIVKSINMLATYSVVKKKVHWLLFHHRCMNTKHIHSTGVTKSLISLSDMIRTVRDVRYIQVFRSKCPKYHLGLHEITIWNDANAWKCTHGNYFRQESNEGSHEYLGNSRNRIRFALFRRMKCQRRKYLMCLSHISMVVHKYQ